jgi:hypothetical protein
MLSFLLALGVAPSAGFHISPTISHGTRSAQLAVSMQKNSNCLPVSSLSIKQTRSWGNSLALTPSSATALRMSDWSTFQALEDDDDLDVIGKKVDKNQYAAEEDSQELKASLGEGLKAPDITDPPTDPIFVQPGMYHKSAVPYSI